MAAAGLSDEREAGYVSLRDAEAALRLINAARQVRGVPGLEMTALELARARTISALDSVLREAGLWARLSQQDPVPDNPAEAETALTDAVTDVLVRVGHVPPPRVADVVLVARRALDAVPPDSAITAADIVAAARVALVQLRQALITLANEDGENVALAGAAVDERWRGVLDTAGQALVHVVSAGGVPAQSPPRWASGLLAVVTTLSWGIAGNLATDAVKGMPDVPPQPAAVAVPAASAGGESNPFSKLRDAHGGSQQLDPIQLRNLRQDLLDDIAGNDRWSPAYRLARLDQLVMDGAVPAAEARPVRDELERQQAQGT
jgi:hypothetical protein